MRPLYSYSSEFLSSLQRLEDREQSPVERRLKEDISKALERVERAKVKRWKKHNVSDDLRLIVYEQGDQLILGYVAHHDPALKWAESRRTPPVPVGIWPPPDYVSQPPHIESPGARVIVQDVDAENARILFDHFVWIGDSRRPAQTDFFAPYFTQKCADNSLVPEVNEPGIKKYFKVFGRSEYFTIDQLLAYQNKALYGRLPQPSRPKWKDGMTAIARLAQSRARDLEWQKWDPHWVECLDPGVVYELDECIRKNPSHRGCTRVPRDFNLPFSDLIDVCPGCRK